MFTPRRLYAVVLVALCAAVAGLAAESDLFQAARAGDFLTVQAALADDPGLVAASTPAGETLLHFAAAGQRADVIALLLGYGVDVNAADVFGRTALHVAASTRDAKAVGLLIAAGANVQAADGEGDTPLHVAARLARGEVVARLLAAGANPNAANGAGQTPLHVAGLAVRPEMPEAQPQIEALARTLIAAGADPKQVDNAGVAAWPHVEEEEGETRQPTGYPTYDQIAATLLTWANTYPGLCQRFDLGPSTLSGKDIWALKISDNVGVEEDEPEMKYISTMHGDEVTGVVMCLNLIDYLLTNYGSIPRVTNIVDNMEIWIVPCMNPWGYTNNARYNLNGEDLNRSFPEGHPPTPQPNTTTGRELEVATIMNWSFAHSFTLAANFHGGALVVNYPFDSPGSGSQYCPDDDMYQYISLQYSIHNTPMYNSSSFFHGITNGYDWYEAQGGMQDWDYRYMGGHEVTIELGDKSPPYSTMPTYWSQNRDSMLSYMETCLIGVRGLVYDALSGAPLAATVRVTGRAIPTYTDPDVGDYHRMLIPGTYTLTFEAAGYDPVTVSGVVVSSGAATRLDVPIGPTEITYPNGGESLPVNEPATITWLGSPTSPFQVQYAANYGAGTIVSDNFEDGNLTEYTQGTRPWMVTTASVHGGTYAARGSVITHNQICSMTRALSGPGQLSFWYRVSSEQNYDFFNFYIDGQSKLHLSGNGTWTQYTTTLTAGSHTLKWEYLKDVSASYYEDTAYVDDLYLANDLTAWTDIVNPTDPGAHAEVWTPTAEGTTYKVRVRTIYGGGNYGPWDESDAMFGVVSGPQYPLGDMNCDATIDFGDINPFVTALIDPTAYGLAYPNCDIMLGDVNGNDSVGFDDINPFVDVILGAP